MQKLRAVVLLIAVTAFTAAADPPRTGVAEANGLLEQGKAEAAIQAYRNLQIDDPESDLLYYNIGCAHLESIPEPSPDQDNSAAIDSLNAAKISFDKAVMAEDATIRRDARYNRINCDSQLAKRLQSSGDYKGTVSAFEDAIYGYEDFLDQYADHAGARKNLNHMRYQLKKMLQNPPPEQDQQEQQDQENGEGEEGDQQEQQDQDGEQEDGEENNDSGEDESQGESQDQQPGDNPGDDQKDGEDQQQESGEDPSDDGEPGDASSTEDDHDKPGDDQTNRNGTPGDEPVDLPSRETIEAILDALQEQDQEEQKNMRRVRQNLPRSNKWW